MRLRFTPADCQRHTCAHVVQGCLATREGHPVIAGNDYDGIVELIHRFKALNDITNLIVESLYLSHVVSEIISHDRVIGQARGDFDVRQFNAGLLAEACFIRAMRFTATVPKTEWLSCFALFQEVVKGTISFSK